VAVAADKGPITIAFMAELTAQRLRSGRTCDRVQNVSGREGYKIAGRQIKFVVEDHGEADVAVPKVRRFITSDKVAVIAGSSARRHITPSFPWYGSECRPCD